MLENVLEQCSGCRACEQACPMSCIEFKYDDEGFIYPLIDTNKCIQCGKCEKICHLNFAKENAGNRDEENRKGYKSSYYYYGSKKIQRASSSGGAFSFIIENVATMMEFPERQLKIFGAAWADDNRSVFQKEVSYPYYNELRKSKYVFSDPQESFSRVHNLIEDKNVFVIYSGTPCQIAGLYAYLGERPKNLLTIDFICHGVPSAQILNQHIDFIMRGRKVKKIDFRSKTFGWRQYCLRIENVGKTYCLRDVEDFYLTGFMNNLFLRQSCYFCPYRKKHHSDITLADYWGIKHIEPKLENSRGVSTIFVNTKFGESIIEKHGTSFDGTLVCVNSNGKEYSGEALSLESREKFFEKYHSVDFEVLEKEFIQSIEKSALRRWISRRKLQVKLWISGGL